MEALLIDLRIHGSFTDVEQSTNVENSTRALRRLGWSLSADGYMTPIGQIDLESGGRDALDEQIGRLRRSTDDPAQLLGSAKDLLEAVAKFVLEEVGMPQGKGADFTQIWYLARERLGLLPQSIDISTPGGKHVRAIMQESWKIIESVNDLRNLQGVGHGRTLPTGVTAETALMVVRQACLMADFTLGTLDRLHGRANPHSTASPS